mmetsp:Transcript_62/g.123  ORF Transcript_62/g.123 Transcript_62/m.123 type:complete len:679 (+) Transcript_62:25-2061(+)|eukprot:CAMPEP_0175865598 /NCGR_PEP_ID=MMETSP0107_2-20121207/33734_1 /TAXON_ID=195067 ORGANISM="Goniomonas pacifica, Strain CCMP1869" /NCGR_SAMPLE_ID=MMETSP0107_2 /ASSEMBLY_ACC=CAM_ASM_000203 /LENGTH=678 /DNA_ID=CAMNT_0017183015 /DNA_START=18 /DNA_END=2054 /DNA_ORIENTATION=+
MGAQSSQLLDNYTLVVDVDNICHGNAEFRQKRIIRRLSEAVPKTHPRPLVPADSDAPFAAPQAACSDSDPGPDSDYLATVSRLQEHNDLLIPDGWSVHLERKKSEAILSKVKQLASGKMSVPLPTPSELSEADVAMLDTLLMQVATEELGVSSYKAVVSFTGFFNRGKTWLLNALTKRALPSQRRLSTRGLSFVIPEDKAHPLVYVDSAGSGTPTVASTAEDLAFKKATETFLSDTLFELSDCMIVVVNELTWQDQEFLEALTERNKSEAGQRDLRKIIVVHNLQSCTDPTDFHSQIKRNVVRNYQGEAQKVLVHVGPKVEKECQFWEDARGRRHYFLAHHGSKAGDNNDATLEGLSTFLVSLQASRARIGSESQGLLLQRILGALHVGLVDHCLQPSEPSLRANWKRLFADEAEASAGAQVGETHLASQVAEQHLLKHIRQIDPSLLRILKMRAGFGPDMSTYEHHVQPQGLLSLNREEDVIDGESLGYSDINIQCEGDLTLRRGLLAYDGTSMYLKRNATGGWTPKVDLLELHDAAYILVDAPMRGGDHIGGGLLIKTESAVKVGQHVVRIEGWRELYTLAPSTQADSKEDPEVRFPYTRQGRFVVDQASNLKVRIDRPHGKFEVTVFVSSDYDVPDEARLKRNLREYVTSDRRVLQLRFNRKQESEGVVMDSLLG